MPGAFEAVSAGSRCTCGVRADRSAACWGTGSHGEHLLPAGPFDAISIGENHGCGLRPGGDVECWGRSDLLPPERTFERGALRVVAGFRQTCVLAADRSLACWTAPISDVPGEPPPEGTFSELALGNSHGCALNERNILRCWGDDSYGKATPPPLGFSAISVGAIHSCGILVGGRVFCWGID